MAELSKVVSGNLYIDTFDSLNYIWEMMPSNTNRITVANGSVTMKHGDARLTMLMTMPDGDFVFQTKINHEPFLTSDVGGIIVMSDINTSVECQTYYSESNNIDQYYSYIKVTRIQDTYTFYASKNGTIWDIIGASKIIDANKIGFFLDGEETAGSKDFIIEEVSVYKSNYVTVLNSFNSMYVGLYDSNRNLLCMSNTNSDSKIILDTTSIPMPIKNGYLRVFSSTELIHEEQLDIHGGDIFDYVFNLSIYINDVLIDPASEYFLGSIDVLGSEYLVRIVNHDSQTLINKIVSIAQYSSFFRGDHFVQLALETEEGTIGTYGDTITITELRPNESINIWMRINRDLSNDAPFFANQYKYKIIID